MLHYMIKLDTFQNKVKFIYFMFSPNVFWFALPRKKYGSRRTIQTPHPLSPRCTGKCVSAKTGRYDGWVGSEPYWPRADTRGKVNMDMSPLI